MPFHHLRILNHFVHELRFRKLASLTFPYSTFTSDISNAHRNQSSPIINMYLSLLQESPHNLFWVSSIHAQITVNSLPIDPFLSTKLVELYADLGHLERAYKVFDQVPEPKLSLYKAMMRGYMKREKYSDVLNLFQMGSHILWNDGWACNAALKACMSLMDYEAGVEVIGIVIKNGLGKDRFCGSSMVCFLVKFGKIDEAQRVFDGICEKDVVCWNSMIGGYVQVCKFLEAFNLFFEMVDYGIKPSPVTIASLVQACGVAKSLELGKCVHGCVLGLGMRDDILVDTCLVDMYFKLGDIESAFMVFNNMTARNLISWNAMISGCVQNGLVCEAFDYFHKFFTSTNQFDSGTIVSLLQGCSQIANLKSGKVLHACIFRRGLELNITLSTVLVDFYAKCGTLELASFVFDRMKDRNVITWTAMLVGLAQNGHAEYAIKLFSQMQEEGVAANSTTLVSLVHSCSHLGSLRKGKSIHAYLIRNGFVFDVVNMTALIDMYKSSSLHWKKAAN
ncbi:Pentatricopeptide repeat [Dillenia turbinata]|uniref:Pentatricopeptide repeat n=1 Tax=Dillenia turbinata TaxID=194707 RepID=A0AAN8WBE1_9MAGN